MSPGGGGGPPCCLLAASQPAPHSQYPYANPTSPATARSPAQPRQGPPQRPLSGCCFASSTNNVEVRACASPALRPGCSAGADTHHHPLLRNLCAEPPLPAHGAAEKPGCCLGKAVGGQIRPALFPSRLPVLRVPCPTDLVSLRQSLVGARFESLSTCKMRDFREKVWANKQRNREQAKQLADVELDVSTRRARAAATNTSLSAPLHCTMCTSGLRHPAAARRKYTYVAGLDTPGMFTG